MPAWKEESDLAPRLQEVLDGPGGAHSKWKQAKEATVDSLKMFATLLMSINPKAAYTASALPQQTSTLRSGPCCSRLNPMAILTRRCLGRCDLVMNSAGDPELDLQAALDAALDEGMGQLATALDAALDQGMDQLAQPSAQQARIADDEIDPDAKSAEAADLEQLLKESIFEMSNEKEKDNVKRILDEGEYARKITDKASLDEAINTIKESKWYKFAAANVDPLKDDPNREKAQPLLQERNRQVTEEGYGEGVKYHRRRVVTKKPESEGSDSPAAAPDPGKQAAKEVTNTTGMDILKDLGKHISNAQPSGRPKENKMMFEIANANKITAITLGDINPELYFFQETLRHVAEQPISDTPLHIEVQLRAQGFEFDEAAFFKDIDAATSQEEVETAVGAGLRNVGLRYEDYYLAALKYQKERCPDKVTKPVKNPRPPIPGSTQVVLVDTEKCEENGVRVSVTLLAAKFTKFAAGQFRPTHPFRLLFGGLRPAVAVNIRLCSGDIFRNLELRDAAPYASLGPGLEWAFQRQPPAQLLVTVHCRSPLLFNESAIIAGTGSSLQIQTEELGAFLPQESDTPDDVADQVLHLPEDPELEEFIRSAEQLVVLTKTAEPPEKKEIQTIRDLLGLAPDNFKFLVLHIPPKRGGPLSSKIPEDEQQNALFRNLLPSKDFAAVLSQPNLALIGHGFGAGSAAAALKAGKPQIDWIISGSEQGSDKQQIKEAVQRKNCLVDLGAKDSRSYDAFERFLKNEDGFRDELQNNAQQAQEQFQSENTKSKDFVGDLVKLMQGKLGA